MSSQNTVIFGDYETVSRCAATPTVTVWAARPVGSSSPPTHVVKAFHPSGKEPEETELSSERVLFFEAARTQAKVSAADRRHWAPILETGSHGEMAFLVTKFYRRSVRWLTERRFQLSSRTLHAVVSGVADGLLSLKRVCGRAHGNLKLSNVLIEGQGRITPSRVVLTDPLPRVRLDPQAGEVTDLHAIGAMIYQLVLRRPFRLMGGWPVQPSEAWTKLGRHGEAWREWCDRLLSPDLGKSKYSLEDLAGTLKPLGGARKLWAYAAAGVSAAAVILAVVALWPGRKWDEGAAARWNRLCLAYEAWFQPFLSDTKDSGRRARWQKDVHLARVLAERDRVKPGHHPREIADRADTSLPELAKNPTDETKTGKGIRKAKHSWEIVERVTKLVADWPRKDEVLQQAKQLGERGWEARSRYLASRVEGLAAVSAGHPPADLGEKIDAVLEVGERLGRYSADILGQRAELDRWRERIQGEGDEWRNRLLGRLDSAFLTDTRSRETPCSQEDLADLQRRLPEVVEGAESIAGDCDAIQHSREVVQRCGDKVLSRLEHCLGEQITSRVDASRQDNVEALVSHVRQVAKTVKDISALCGRITVARETAEREGSQWNSTVLAGLGAFVDTEGSPTEDLDELRRALEEVESVSTRLVEFLEGDWQTEVAQELFFNDGEVPLPPDGVPDENTITTWLDQVKGYYRLAEDPLGDWNPRAVVDTITSVLEDGRSQGELTQAQHDDFLGKLVQLQRELKEIHASPKIRKNLDEIKARAKSVDASLAALRSEVDEACGLSRSQMAAFIDTICIPPISGSRVVNAEWEKRRDHLLRSLSEDLCQEWSGERERILQGLIENRAEFSSVRPKVSALRDFLAAQEAAPPGALSDREGWRSNLTELTEDRREEALAECLSAIVWKEGLPDAATTDSTRIERIRDDFRRLLADVEEVENLLIAGESRLSACYGIDGTPVGEEKTARELYEDCKQNPAFRKEPALQALEPARHLELLEKVSALQDRVQLVSYAKSNRCDLAVTAWRKLGKLSERPWPADFQELDEESKISQGLASAFEQIVSPRKEVLQKELSGERARRWLVCFGHMMADRSVSVKDKDDRLASLIKAGKGFGVKDEALPSWVLYDILLHDLRSTSFAELSEEEALARKSLFIGEVKKLPGSVRDRGFVGELIGRLESLSVGPDGAREAGLDAAGPASVGWTRSAVTGESVEYLWTSSTGTKHTLRFVLLRPQQSQRSPCYLCTTEVSLGLFTDWVSHKRKWDDVRSGGFLYNYGADGEDGRKGPRVWEWLPDRAGIREVGQWLNLERSVRDIREQGREYATGITLGNPSKPSRRHPLNYVSPEGSLWFSRLIGCRLPTSPEWGTAHLAVAGVEPPKWNLRDATWARQRDHILQLQKEYRKTDWLLSGLKSWPWPDGDIFLPPSLTKRIPRGERAQPATSKNDGILWFEAVDSRGGVAFHHLVGNVGEIVLDSSDPSIAEFQNSSAPSAAEIRDLLRKHRSDVGVIGSSSLSPEEVNPLEANRLNGSGPQVVYSDVGFRLAFTAPGESPIWRLKGILDEKDWYLSSVPLRGDEPESSR